MRMLFHTAFLGSFAATASYAFTIAMAGQRYVGMTAAAFFAFIANSRTAYLGSSTTTAFKAFCIAMAGLRWRTSA